MKYAAAEQQLSQKIPNWDYFQGVMGIDSSAQQLWPQMQQVGTVCRAESQSEEPTTEGHIKKTPQGTF